MLTKQRSTRSTRKESTKPAPSTRTRASRGRLSQTDKAAKKLRGLQPGVGTPITKQVFTVMQFAKHAPKEIAGYIVEQDEHGVIFRQKKSSGSRMPRKHFYKAEDIISVVGAKGETSVLRIMGRTPIGPTIKGYISRSKTSNLIRVKDATTGEITTIWPNDNIDLEIYADEESTGTGRGRAASGRRRNRNEDSFDEEDDGEL